MCSIRQYVRNPDGSTGVAQGSDGELRITCPFRFYESDLILHWIGSELLGHDAPKVVKEVGFLQALPTIAELDEPPVVGRRRKEIGRIDMVLVHPDHNTRLEWCAVEVQAVYFSGDTMGDEFSALASGPLSELPFPVGRRRPDYRSSGPKRLLPQLQTKVNDISRWGRRMAVVVDRPFFRALAQMDFERDVSNADLAWFVVKLEEPDGRAARLVRDAVQYTKLESAVRGLTGGRARTQSEFESSIRAKLGQAKSTIQE